MTALIPGNHAQALALAASTFQVPAYIVMPSISTPSKISGTRTYTPHVIFSGSTSQEREAKVAEVIERTGAILVPPYDHPDIILGQATVGLELYQQVPTIRCVVAPLGGGGLLSGQCIFFNGKAVHVHGVEPSFEGADDGKRGMEAGERIETVKSLTIADGLRTPMGQIPWDKCREYNVSGLHTVTEEQIKKAMRLAFERLKVVIEPSAAVPLAAVLYNVDLRAEITEMEMQDGDDVIWDVGIILSGGNTTVDAVAKLFT